MWQVRLYSLNLEIKIMSLVCYLRQAEKQGFLGKGIGL